MKRLFHIIALLLCASVAMQAQSNTRQRQLNDGIFSAEELEHRRRRALEDIELTTRLLQETNASAKLSLNRLNLLSQQLVARRRIVNLLGEEIAAIDRNINTMVADIKSLQTELDKTKNNYARALKNQHSEHRSTQHKMLLILSADNLSQSYRRMRYMREYSDWQKTEADRIIARQEEIERRKSLLEDSRKSKMTLFSQREEESKKIEAEEKQQKADVNEINKKRKNLQQQLEQKRKEADALNRQIENLIAEDINDSGRAAAPSSDADKAAAEPATTAPARNTHMSGYVMNESETELSKNFINNKGKLPYPLSGRYTIISTFGEHQHQALSYVRTNNNGIDIQTTVGTEARVIFKGVVTRVFVMPGFNNNVIVRHGNYLTVYSNLSTVYVKAGDVVDTRQAIGKIYTDTEKGNETILHFQVWHERTKLNPLAWIK